jgi:hypothetical protein
MAAVLTVPMGVVSGAGMVMVVTARIVGRHQTPPGGELGFGRWQHDGTCGSGEQHLSAPPQGNRRSGVPGARKERPPREAAKTSF